MGRSDNKNIFLLGLAHFCVDLCCTALLTMAAFQVRYDAVVCCALIYNGLAFAFQLPIGTLADKLRLQRSMAILGCILVGLGALVHDAVWMSLVIGLGNACFHVGGGREALKRGGYGASQVGRFVSPGAIGIFLGPKLARTFWFGRGLPVACMMICVLLLATKQEPMPLESITGGKRGMGRSRLGAVIVCMFATVVLRAYMGTVLRYTALSDIRFSLAYTMSIFLGKHYGGVLADKFGAVRACFVTQVLGILLLAGSVLHPLLALPGIFLFNTTMAVTAFELYACVPGHPGAMFGLTTFALFLGGVPRLLGWRNHLFTPSGIFFLSLLSSVFLLAGLLVMEKEGAAS